MCTSSDPQVSLKLFIDKTQRKILFGEADKNFIDFLFSILALPIGTMFDLVTTEAMSAPLGNLYHSVQNLSSNYFQESDCKKTLLKPGLHIPQSRISLFPIESSLPKPQECYVCSTTFCSEYFSTKSKLLCPECNTTMNLKLKPVFSPDEMKMESLNAKIGYVKDVSSYLVMEDLTVKPMSVMSNVSMLAELGVVDVGTIEEKLVYLDVEKGLNLLRASFRSSTILSDVFLHEIGIENSSTVSDKEVASEDETLAKKSVSRVDNPLTLAF